MHLRIPKSKYKKAERIGLFYGELNNWVSSKYLYNLVKLFGGDDYRSLPFYEKVNYLINFSNEKWDKRNKNSLERYEIKNDDFMSKNKNFIIEASANLGLSVSEDIKNDIKKIQYNYICPLGGFRMANYRRAELAKKLMKYQKGAHILALSGLRPINMRVEMPSIIEYAGGAKTEFDVMNISLDLVFGKNFHENRSISIAGKNGKRATTNDLFREFFDKKFLKEYEKVLFISGSLYAEEQILLAFPYALKFNVDIDITGTDSLANPTFANESINYLQEISAIIYNINNVYEKYIKNEI